MFGVAKPFLACSPCVSSSHRHSSCYVGRVQFNQQDILLPGNKEKADKATTALELYNKNYEYECIRPVIHLILFGNRVIRIPSLVLFSHSSSPFFHQRHPQNIAIHQGIPGNRHRESQISIRSGPSVVHGKVH
jgi:hypothetical protein